jgi:hypothetical protein
LFGNETHMAAQRIGLPSMEEAFVMSTNAPRRQQDDRHRSAGVLTPQKMERRGRELGRPYELSLEPPFVHRVAPDPPKNSREMPAPVAEIYQLAMRKTGDIERDFYREDERLRQEIAADAQTIKRAATWI